LLSARVGRSQAQRRRRAVLDVELSQHVLDVLLDGARLDVQDDADLRPSGIDRAPAAVSSPDRTL
jgi:hypothetical protein